MKDTIRNRFFGILKYTISVGEDFQKGHEENSEAAVKLEVFEPSGSKKVFHETSDGVGPVDALSKALRKALTGIFPEITQVRLTGYDVHKCNGDKATESLVEVTVTSSDGTNTWETKGVSNNIIKASFIALVKSLEKEILVCKDR